VVEALQARRGVPFSVAVTPGAELGNLTRLTTPNQLMSSLGLTPSEYASGPRRSQGGLTKTANSQARRARVEGAWAYR
jgi:transposase